MHTCVCVHKHGVLWNVSTRVDLYDHHPIRTWNCDEILLRVNVLNVNPETDPGKQGRLGPQLLCGTSLLASKELETICGGRGGRIISSKHWEALASLTLSGLKVAVKQGHKCQRQGHKSGESGNCCPHSVEESGLISTGEGRKGDPRPIR